ncbi:MAG: DNA polymerase III subunit chi [Magnetococcales bacterium]|nr:DNA polymerase III subunit chi [Magnetococcales bacterium]MBF0321971.1 DNA polymerase III subunit chi [Magnetococcales bacterium]
MARSGAADIPPTVRFYQAAGGDPYKLVAILAAKALERGLRLAVVAAHAEQAQYLDQFLWRYPDNSFLPHALATEPDPDLQPLLIDTTPSDRNGATVLLVASSQIVASPNQFDLIIDFAYANDHADNRHYLASRQRYSHYQQLGCTMEYWVQNSAGGWEKKTTPGGR